jgi:tyrosyl-tRNA synthetase
VGPDDLSTLLAGAAEVVPDGELERKLALGRPLRIKLGLDPTAPVVTLGWAVVLRKLRQFQDTGHVAVLIVGDFTARVGDPSGKTETRPRLSKEEVLGYRDRLLEQFWLILDRERTEVRHNSEWLEPLGMEDVLRLTASTTVARMLERDDFAKRYASGQPISLMEFLYPLLQGMDSVAVAADVELGGTDQKFNLLVGRDLQRDAGLDPQVAFTMPLLVGTDGANKMSQSLGNYVAITEDPDEMFGKLYRIDDELPGRPRGDLIAEYRRLTLDFFRDPSEADRVAAGLADGSLEPRAEKRRMAREIVDLYHGDGAGARSEAEYDRVFRSGELPDVVRDVKVARTALLTRKKDGVVVLLDRAALLTELGLASTKSEARRLFEQGGVRQDGAVIRDPELRVDVPGRTGAEAVAALQGTVWQVGKRRFARVAGFSDELPRDEPGT